MTTPSVETKVTRWWTRPPVVLSLIMLMVLLVSIITPEPTQTGRTGDARLSSHLSGSLGGKLLFELADRLGWRVVSRDSLPVPTGTPWTTIHAVLAPPLKPTRAQAHLYMQAVRAGDALLLVLDGRNALSDSLGVRYTPAGGVLTVDSLASARCESRDRTPSLWPDGQAHLYGVRSVGVERPNRVTFATVHGQDKNVAIDAAIGFEVGRGRVAVVSDPDLLRNDVLRRCQWGADVIAVRMLEWLSQGGATPRTTVEFDEFHQGYGPKHSTTAAVRRFLTRHPVGRTIFVVALAALVLLFAVAPRALLPTQRLIVERRDPLEQVDALAHAYEQVGATRTAVIRLLHGVRARVQGTGGLSRTRTDEMFLDDVVANDRDRADDVALIRRALREKTMAGDLSTIGAALRRIEYTFTKARA